MVKVVCRVCVVHFLYCMWSNCKKGLMRTFILFLLRVSLFDERRIMKLFAIVEFLRRSHHFPFLSYFHVMFLFILFVEFDFYHLRNGLAKLQRRRSWLFILFTRGKLWSKCESIDRKKCRIMNFLKSVWHKFVVCP